MRKITRKINGGGNPRAGSGCAELGLSQKDLVDFAGRLETAFSGVRSLVEMRHPGVTARAAAMVRADPVKYARIAVRLMDGQSAAEIEDIENVPAELLRCMRMAHPEILHAGRLEILANLEEVSVAFTRRLVAEHHDLPIDKVPQALSTVIEKLALLSGGATQRVEHANVPSKEELKAMFEALPKADAQLMGEAAVS